MFIIKKKGLFFHFKGKGRKGSTVGSTVQWDLLQMATKMLVSYLYSHPIPRGAYVEYPR